MEVVVETAVSSSAQSAPAARPAARSTPGSSVEKVTAKKRTDDEKKLPQKPKQLPQKPEVESVFAGNFAGTDLIDDEDLEDDDLDFYAKVDSKVWRVETRTYTKQDGTTMLYFNYRRRKSYVKSGKRIIPYKKGGKRVLNNGKE